MPTIYGGRSDVKNVADILTAFSSLGPWRDVGLPLSILFHLFGGLLRDECLGLLDWDILGL